MLDPRKDRGRDAVLVGLKQFAIVGALTDQRVLDARVSLSRHYGGRRIDALDALIVPALAPATPQSVDERLAAHLPTFYAGLVLDPQVAVTKNVFRFLAERGVPSTVRAALAAASDISPEVRSLYARARLASAQLYWRAVDVDQAAALASGFGAARPDDATLVLAIAIALRGGPDDAADMMRRVPRRRPAEADVAALDANREGIGERVGRALRRGARARVVLTPQGAPATHFQDVARRYHAAASALSDAKAKAFAADRAAAADQDRRSRALEPVDQRWRRSPRSVDVARRAILHVDMDAFYASVEQRDEPRLRGRPVIVGGASRRGVVAAASYEVRKFGVHSAMPMAEALRRCPHAIVVSPRMSRYVEASERVFEVFRRYTPLVEGLSLDEAFLDVTGSESLFGDGPTIARRIKGEILVDTGLTASAGVSPIKFAAKIASDLDKPNGLVVVPDDVRSFLAPLPLERMWGIGLKAAPRVREAGFATFGDLAAADLDALEPALGRAGALHAKLLAQGEDPREVVPGRAAVSVGAEETYENDLMRREDMEVRLLELAARVAQRLVHADLSAGGVTVKVKYADFSIKTRAKKFDEPVADTDSIYALRARAPRPRAEGGASRCRSGSR